LYIPWGEDSRTVRILDNASPVLSSVLLGKAIDYSTA
jgi:hypothetical protein